MVMVKFATLCDVNGPKCLRRSEEYTGWPTCRICGVDCCAECAVPGTLQERHFDRDGDGDHGPEAAMTQSVICTMPECEGEYRDELAAAVREMAHPRRGSDVINAV